MAAMRSEPAAQPSGDVDQAGAAVVSLDRRERVYVWEVPVRVTHWVTFIAVMILILTGAYIADPFITMPGISTMTTARFVHMVAAYVFLAAFIVRIYWMFAGNRWARWSAFIPTSRRHVHDLFQQLGWYLLVRPRPPKAVGHNPLASSSYMVVFVLFFVQIVTGFALAGLNGTEPWASLFGWVTAIFGPQGVRLIHHLVMWAILAFLVHHVYAAVLVDHWDGSGLLSSIFTGFKYLRRTEVEEARDGGLLVEEPSEEEPRSAQKGASE